MAAKRIGIRFEDKADSERRAPLTPENVRVLRALEEIEVCVQPSPNRVYPDNSYEQAGARVSDDLSDCDLIIGIKEIPVDRLVDGKPHLFFSHTIKGQEYNMDLLRQILERKVTLIDYERVTDDDGMRLIAFSVQAGQAGMINSLWSLGQRLLAKGIANPLDQLKQARQYSSLDEAREAIAEAGERIRKEGFDDSLGPVILAITGIGRVSSGAQELLDPLGPISLAPEDVLDEAKRATLSSQALYKVVLDMEDFLARADGTPGFDFQEYLAHPWRYVSRSADFLPHLTVLVNGIYWEDRFPRLLTRQDAAELEQSDQSRLQVIGDVTCDPEGSIEITLTPTLPEDPVYVYNPIDGTISYGFEEDGLLVMPVDILPTEIPDDSSRHFGEMLMPWISRLVNADYSVDYEHLDLPDEWKRAVIAHQGELTPAYEYLYDALEGSDG